ncbi:VCBS domain-containing protein [Pseudomonas sp. GOM6]|uniref:VCBS domain-containing protein n=1 Tax=Pseudomonas sp. GOM6 TaxID=3036944 RepID=UPI0024094AD1|nr:VCBS domain-containing protein [Pseudomonas sp. GOM6]MDG1582352.1 VCBS domain-containing protein [Pseudomonas sp. GOM6]
MSDFSPRSMFRPQSHTLALEPRILFDGAAAVAADQQQDADHGTDSEHTPATQVESAASVPTQAGAKHLLVIDSRVESREKLISQLPEGVQALVVNLNQDGIAAIEQALEALGQVDSIQILSHGAAGQFTLGNTTISADNVDQLGERLQQWSNNLNAGADIQLYGCRVGAGNAGQTLVAQLAYWTGADVAASDDNTGSLSAGGDWELEVRSGDIDKGIALSQAALNDYDALLATPNTSLPASTANVLLGDAFTFTVNFKNQDIGQPGYAPFMDLFFPATGRDGEGAETDDGITFVSASYLGQALTTHALTFDANGQASHPLAVGSDGQPLIINAADFGMRAGDQLVVVELPFASVSAGQPTIGIQVTATLSSLADTNFDPAGGSPDLTIRARSGFQYGNDSLNNPATDPSILEAGSVAYVVHPTIISFDQVIYAPEGETATGPNYGRTMDLTVTPATSQPVGDIVITQPVPDNVIIRSITPAAGGTITSITLYDGRSTTDPALIQAALALNNDADLTNDLYIQSFTISYAALAGPTTTQVEFFIPDNDADGLPVIDPVSGDPVTITFGQPTASGQWQPLDSRDVDNPGDTITFSGTGNTVSVTAKSITLLKEVSIQTDIGAAGLTPGDTLNYTLSLNISDYFAFGENFFEQGSFVIVDVLGDAQTLVPGSGTVAITVDGTTINVALVTTSVIDPVTGISTLTLDLAQSLRNATGDRGWVNGDLAFDAILQGATQVVVSYQVTLGQSYTPPSGTPHSEINEGDTVGNNATLTATILEDRLNLTGDEQSDGSQASITVPSSQVEITIADLNGNGAPAPGVELRPGDEVTFQLSYDLVTGDYENFTLTAYLPLPLFDLSSIADISTIWSLGSGNTNPEAPTSVTRGLGNSLVFTFADYVNSGTDGSRIEIDFTLTVSDQPFADQRSFNVTAESNQTTTLNKSTQVTTDDVALIASVAEPVLSITHGVVSSSNGSVTGTTGGWNPPGTSGKPFTDANLTETSAVDGSVSAIDGGDTLRLATAIENSGGGQAYDVSTRITLPTGLSFVGGNLASANLLVYRGDGTLLQSGVDFTVDNATNTITFIDDAGAGTGALEGGRAGTANDLSGANLVVITYDVVVAANIDASATLQTEAELVNYASVEGGQNFLASGTLEDLADQQIAAPEIRKNFAGNSLDNSDSSASHTTGANLVVGESMLYDIIVTLPEGTTQSLRIDDLIPPGLRLDTSFNGGRGYEIITSAGGALSANFAGTLTGDSINGISGTLGDDGVDGRFVFSVASASADNNTGNNTFVIRVRLVASNVTGNQAGSVLQNDAQLTYSDSDGDTPNGNTPVDRDVAVIGSKPSVTVREPTLNLAQQLTTDPGFGFDEGDTVDFTITVSNGNAGSDYDAFDIDFSSALPAELDGLTLVSAIYTVNGVATDITSSFTLDPTGRTLVNNSNLDILKGGTLVLTVTGTVNATGASGAEFDNLAEVRWTSLDGSNSDERTGSDGVLNSNVLNDYRRENTLVIPVAQGIRISRIGGLADTVAPSQTNASTETVAIGEIIRYRATALIPEGVNTGYQLQIVLAEGLTYDDLAGIRIGFISQGGLTSSLSLGDLITSGTLQIIGNEDSAEAQFISSDLSGAAPTGVLNTARIVPSNGGQVLTLNLGDITNNELDGDLEGITIEFNVRVDNSLANQNSTAPLAVQVKEFTSEGPRSTSNILYEQIVEPGFDGLNKQVIDFDPNIGGSSGTATVQTSFTSNGQTPAYDTTLTITGFEDGQIVELISIEVDGVIYGPDNPPPPSLGLGASPNADGSLEITFDRLDPGTNVKVTYAVEVPNGAIQAISNDSLTWSSLPDDFTDWGGSLVGTEGGADGERTGEDGAGADNSVLNNYQLVEGAGLGVISGTLWDDTLSADNSTTPDGAPLAGQTVTLNWAGADGIFGNADDRSYSSETDSNGQFLFGVLPAGLYRIDAPATITNLSSFGQLNIRIDSDGGTLSQISVTLGEGSTAQADSGYVQLNDAPVNSLPGGPLTGDEDTPLAIGGISVSDVDAELDPVVADRAIQVTLSVQQGTLSFTGATTDVTVTGAGTASLVLVGRIADINAALTGLSYQGNPDFNGNDTLQVLTSDLGNYGDFDGNGIPGEASDALTDLDTVTITLSPVNDAPAANDDNATAIEAGGTFNSLPGIDPRGNLLDNDTDVDIATNGDQLNVTQVTSSTGSVSIPTSGTVDVIGTYGTLRIAADGSYQYLLNNDDPRVQALRQNGDTLNESFSYTIRDSGIGGTALTSSATLAIVIRGANDTPVGVNDTGTAYEQGGINNSGTINPGDAALPNTGANATGNVLSNDTDVDGGAGDAINYGETSRVSGVRPLRENIPGALTTISNGGSATVAGLYGSLTLHSDGSYTYTINNDATAVQRLGPSDTLIEYFSYQVTDALGLNDLAELRITIVGNNDNPVASDDQATAQASEVDDDGNESNPSGNVITFPSRPGATTQPGGNGVDSDVDRADRPNTNLTVTGIRNGTEAAGGALTSVSGDTTISTFYAQDSGGAPLPNAGGEAYGELTINPDGSFTFDVNSDHPEIVALATGVELQVIVTYQVTDTAGLTDTAQLVITVRGANNTPLAQNEVALATEAGGIANGTAGVNPSGVVDVADPDGDDLTITAIRTGAEGDTGTSGTIGTELRGLYGWLTINADGTYSYRIDNDMAEVQALREVSDLLTERFTYTVTDNDTTPLSDSAEIIVVIRGANDSPVAADDNATAVEAGGRDNQIPGVDPSGNVLDNDTDVDGGEIPQDITDGYDYGETQEVASVRTGSVEGSGTAGTLGIELRGTYGWLTLNADGSYTYRLDNDMPEVQALRTAADTLLDQFNYTVIDASGATDIALLNITIQGANDVREDNDDFAVAIEAGGVNNGTPGINPQGNVLDNDSDVDEYDETVTIVGVRQGGTVGTVGTPLTGEYGTLTLNADGSYVYVLNNSDPRVQALRTNSDILQEFFTYLTRDAAGSSSLADLTITIRGRNDTPVAVNDSAIAIEAGGTANATPGTNPSGNLLSNDTDVDAGDGKTVQAIRTGTEAAGGTLLLVSGSRTITGTYGSLTVASDGTYTYVVNNSLAAVQALKPGDTLQESFTYQLIDASSAADLAQLNIVIQGAWDTPLAQDDSDIAVADNGDGQVINPTGNVLTNDTDVDAGDSLTVTTVRTGAETGSGTAGTVGSVLIGQYGSLVLNADGSYQYFVDSSNPAVLALDLLDPPLTDIFTYQATDLGGLSDQAQLTILIVGRNDPPEGLNDTATAIEAGGLNNATPGVNPSGNVLNNDIDLESGALTVTAIRTGSESGSGTAGVVGTTLRGLYGDLTMNADGSWSYVLDNSLAVVQALRVSGQTLEEVFTYTLADPYDADDTAELRITIDGRNDTPIANDDDAIAVEAGGIANGIPGVNPSGNVLENDTDVDSVANGETKQVLSFTSELGTTATAGQALQGRYGTLTINADGSYQYVLNNDDPVVQALRTAGQTLRETFTYRMQDTAGAESTARLNLLIQGANDTPVAQNDSNVASDQSPAPQASGNVLPNDGDVDQGERFQVVAIRTGAEGAEGASGTVGQPLTGRYGTLTLNADGSYTYTIDLNNPEVLAAAGLGQVLQDVFTYTMQDIAGASDQAELVITLDIAAPYVPPPEVEGNGWQPYDAFTPSQQSVDLDFEPAVFVTPVVRTNSLLNEVNSWRSDGSNLRLALPALIESPSLQVPQVPGQFVAQSVFNSNLGSDLDLAWILGRQGRIDLTADGLLSDPSLFTSDPADMIHNHQHPEAQATQAQTARSFQHQLQTAAKRLSPFSQSTPRS